MKSHSVQKYDFDLWKWGQQSLWSTRQLQHILPTEKAMQCGYLIALAISRYAHCLHCLHYLHVHCKHLFTEFGRTQTIIKNIVVLTTNLVCGGVACLLWLMPHLPKMKEECWKVQALKCLKMFVKKTKWRQIAVIILNCNIHRIYKSCWIWIHGANKLKVRCLSGPFTGMPLKLTSCSFW